MDFPAGLIGFQVTCEFKLTVKDHLQNCIVERTGTNVYHNGIGWGSAEFFECQQVTERAEPRAKDDCFTFECEFKFTFSDFEEEKTVVAEI